MNKKWQIGLFQKKSKKKRGGWVHGISPVQCKKECMKIPSRGHNKKEVDFPHSGGNQEKIMWNFHGSWFLALEFSRREYVAQGEPVFSRAEFPKK